MINMPEKVHFNLGFGFTYQALIALLIYSILNNKRQTSKLDIPPNLIYYYKDFKKQIDTLKTELTTIDSQYCLMVEGEANFFEDLNIFERNQNYERLLFFQVKGNDRKKGTNEEKLSSINQTIKSAIDNSFKNINIAQLEDFKFFVLTNKMSQKHLSQFLEDYITNFQEYKDMKTYFNHKVQLENYLMQKIEYSQKYNQKFVLNYIDYANLKKYLPKNKWKPFLSSWSINKNNLSKEINTKIRIINNIKIIVFLDHRLLYIYLTSIYGKQKIANKILEIKNRSMDAEEIDIHSFKGSMLHKGFSTNFLNSLQFTKDSRQNYFDVGKIYP